MSDKKNDFLALRKGSGEFGSKLVEAAMERFRGQVQDNMVGFVTTTMQEVVRLSDVIEDMEQSRQWLTDRLNAVESGAFTVARGQIIFNESRLNEPGRG